MLLAETSEKLQLVFRWNVFPGLQLLDLGVRGGKGVVRGLRARFPCLPFVQGHGCGRCVLFDLDRRFGEYRGRVWIVMLLL